MLFKKLETLKVPLPILKVPFNKLEILKDVPLPKLKVPFPKSPRLKVVPFKLKVMFEKSNLVLLPEPKLNVVPLPKLKSSFSGSSGALSTSESTAPASHSITFSS